MSHGFVFMNFLALILNIPWSVLGFLYALLSIPKKITLLTSPPAVILTITSFWWFTWIHKHKGARAMAIGNVVLLGPNTLNRDLEHELVHIKQHQKAPFIHPLLYWIETFHKGYRNNKYEIEAYKLAGNPFIENEKDLKQSFKNEKTNY